MIRVQTDANVGEMIQGLVLIKALATDQDVQSLVGQSQTIPGGDVAAVQWNELAKLPHQRQSAGSLG